MHDRAGVHVFFAAPEALLHADAGLCLDASDRTHIERFVHARDRELATASRILQRQAVAWTAMLAPGEAGAIRFSDLPGERPVVLAPAAAAAMDFNASNTRGMVACAVARDTLVGLDVEQLQAELAPGLLDYCCTRSELAELSPLPEPERCRAFYRLWTLKEAYLKARGIGLQVSPHLIGFHTDPASASIGLDADPTLENAPQRWQFRELQFGSLHAAALCIAGDRVSAHAIRLWRAVWHDGALQLHSQAL